MVVAILITAVALTLVTIMLSVGVQVNNASVRERKWQLALETAETGVESAVTELRANLAFAGRSASAPGGEYDTVVTSVGDSKKILSTGWVPSRTSASAVKRRIEVTYSPEPTFVYALFSNSSLFVNSGSGTIEGDVFANESVTISETTTIFGNVQAATGAVQMQNSSKVRKTAGKKGNVTSGGFDDVSLKAIDIANTARIEGDATVEVATTDATCPTETTTSPKKQAYLLANGGAIDGQVVIPDLKVLTEPAKIPAARRTVRCVFRAGKQPLPQYVFDPANYPGIRYVTTSQFNNATIPGGLIGNVYVRDDGSGLPIDFSKNQILGTLTLIIEPQVIHTNAGGAGTPFFSSSVQPTDVVQLISLNRSNDPNSPSIQVDNQFRVDDPGPAVLVYSPGYCDFKNATVDNGAVYCNGMNIKNGLEITYDPRIKSLIGFGGAKLVRSKFVELTSAG